MFSAQSTEGWGEGAGPRDPMEPVPQEATSGPATTSRRGQCQPETFARVQKFAGQHHSLTRNKGKNITILGEIKLEGFFFPSEG